MPRPFSVPFRACAHSLPGQPSQEQGKHLGEVHCFRCPDHKTQEDVLDAKAPVEGAQKSPGKSAHLLGKENQAKQT